MSLFTAAVNAISGSSAAKAQERAAQRASDITQSQFAKTEANFAPFLKSGTNALSALNDAYGQNGQAGYDRTTQNFRADPGYQYAIDQGTQQVQGSAAARGSLFSGGTLKAIQDRGMNIADQGYGNYLSRIRDMVGIGQSAAGQTGQFGAQAAGAMSQYAIDKGEARATGLIQPALAYNNGLNQIYKTLGSALGSGGAFGAGGAFARG